MTITNCRHFHQEKPAHEVAAIVLEQLEKLEKEGRAAQVIYLTLELSHAPYMDLEDVQGYDPHVVNEVAGRYPEVFLTLLAAVTYHGTEKILGTLFQLLAECRDEELLRAMIAYTILKFAERADKESKSSDHNMGMVGVLEIPSSLIETIAKSVVSPLPPKPSPN